MNLKSASYVSNGVFISPAIPAVNQEVRITYNGLLFRNGASDIYAHVGFGNNWNPTVNYRMRRSEQGFEVSIPIDRYTDNLNICFKDSADNWDNNCGSNYSFPVKKNTA